MYGERNININIPARSPGRLGCLKLPLVAWKTCGELSIAYPAFHGGFELHNKAGEAANRSHFCPAGGLSCLEMLEEGQGVLRDELSWDVSQQRVWFCGVLQAGAAFMGCLSWVSGMVWAVGTN